MDQIPRPTVLIHIGRPDIEEPHKSFERVDKFFTENPDIKFIPVVRKKEDYDFLTEKTKGKNAEAFFWEDDPKLINFLMDRLGKFVGAQIVSSRWYNCINGHKTKGTYGELLEKCSECQALAGLVEPYKDDLQKFAEIFQRVIALERFDTQSGAWLSAQVSPMRNLLFNMPYALGLPEAPAIQCVDLLGSEAHNPAILCAAGPSLDDQIQDIKRLQDTHVILCVGRCLKKLLAAGVKPDFTISVEMFDWDAAIFADLTKEDVEGITLCYASVASPQMVKTWPGRKVCLWDIETGNLLGREDSILGGNSVAHHQLNFAAQILRCDPIILAGQDLAYSKPQTHADDTAPDKWPDAVKQMDSTYQAELWVPCTNKGNAFHPECHRAVSALGGGGFAIGTMEVRSSHAYRCFATLFEILITKHGKKVYNACGNGQKIEGAEYLDLSRWYTNIADHRDICLKA